MRRIDKCGTINKIMVLPIFCFTFHTPLGNKTIKRYRETRNKYINIQVEAKFRKKSAFENLLDSETIIEVNLNALEKLRSKTIGLLVKNLGNFI